MLKLLFAPMLYMLLGPGTEYRAYPLVTVWNPVMREWLFQHDPSVYRVIGPTWEPNHERERKVWRIDRPRRHRMTTDPKDVRWQDLIRLVPPRREDEL